MNEFDEYYYCSLLNDSYQLNQENEYYNYCNSYNAYKNTLNNNDIFQDDIKIEEGVNTIFENKKDYKESSNEGIIKNIVEQSIFISTYVSDKEKVKKHFEIRKINKNLGRKRKNSKYKQTKNDRTRPDNANNRLLTIFSNSTLNYINSKLFKNINRKKMIQKIEPLNKIYSKACKRKALLLKTIGEIFSAPVSERNSTFEKNFNKKLIEKLRKKNKNEKINSLLDKTIGEMYQIYISNTIPEYSLDNDLNLIESNDEDYIALLKEKSSNFIEIINNKKERNRTKK